MRSRTARSAAGPRGRRPQPLSACAAEASLAARACTARGGGFQLEVVAAVPSPHHRYAGPPQSMLHGRVLRYTCRRLDARWPGRPIRSRAPRRRQASAVARRRAIKARPPPARADAARARARRARAQTPPRASARTPAPHAAARKHPQRARARRPPAPHASVRDPKRLRPGPGLRAPREVALRAPRALSSEMASVARWGPSRPRRATVRARSRRAR
jgi:hypothetical protein